MSVAPFSGVFRVVRLRRLFEELKFGGLGRLSTMSTSRVAGRGRSLRPFLVEIGLREETSEEEIFWSCAFFVECFFIFFNFDVERLASFEV